MNQLKALNKYFWKYRIRLGIGVLFVFLSNYFNVLSPQVTGFVIDFVQRSSSGTIKKAAAIPPNYDPLVIRFMNAVEGHGFTAGQVVALCGITILILDRKSVV